MGAREPPHGAHLTRGDRRGGRVKLSGDRRLARGRVRREAPQQLTVPGRQQPKAALQLPNREREGRRRVQVALLLLAGGVRSADQGKREQNRCDT